MLLDYETRKKAIMDTINELGIIGIYARSMDNINWDEIANADPPLTEEEIKQHYVAGGFIAGMDFALANLEISEKGDA